MGPLFGGPVLTREVIVEIRVLARQGKSVREIARQLSLSRNTVRKYLRRRAEDERAPRSQRAHKLDAFKDYLRARVQAAHPSWLPATALLVELRERGYTGGITQLRIFLTSLRTIAAPDPVVRFETQPGHQMQVDWIVFRRGKMPLSAFVATLGYSWASYVEFVTNERLPTLIACHEHAFDYFGGVPREVLYDNVKTVVIGRDTYGPGLHRYQPAFMDFAGHYGFVARLCRPYRAKTKGKVERFNGYLRRSFYNPLASRLSQDRLLLDAATANGEVMRWLRNVANVRIHGTTGQSPLALLLIEQEKLQAQPRPWRAALPTPSIPTTIEQIKFDDTPIQHRLSVYQALLTEAR